MASFLSDFHAARSLAVAEKDEDFLVSIDSYDFERHHSWVRNSLGTKHYLSVYTGVRYQVTNIRHFVDFIKERKILQLHILFSLDSAHARVAGVGFSASYLHSNPNAHKLIAKYLSQAKIVD